MFTKKYSVSILDNTWKVIVPKLKVKYIPRKDEFIYLDEFKSYFQVISIVHYLTKKQGIFLVVNQLKNFGKNIA
jgi:hypothetical protein